MSKAAFIVRMSNDGFHKVAMEKGLVVVGWSGLTGLKTCDAPEYQKRFENIKTVLRNSGWYNNKERAIGNVAGSLHRFLFEIKNGDYVIYPRHKGFHVGVVDAEGASKATYDSSLASEDCAWCWKVNWLAQDDGSPRLILRSYLEAHLAGNMKFMGTCMKLDDDAVIELETAIKAKSAPTVSGALKADQGAVNSVIAVLQKVLTPDRLEELIEKLLECEGAHVVRCRTGKRGSAGDIDLQAVFGVSYCGSVRECDEVIYGYQVKRHVGKSDSKAVKQLVDRFEEEEPAVYTKGIAITTGEFDQSAIDLKNKFNSGKVSHGQEIILLNGVDLAKWVVNVGLTRLEEYGF